MKKKNKVQALAFMLAATLTMALISPMSAKAEKFAPVSLVDRKTESNVYGGMIWPQMAVATDAAEEYNLVDSSTEAATEQVRSYYVKNSHGDIIGQVDEYGNLLNSYAYNAFGELVAAVTIQPEKTKNTSLFLYAGEQYDETSGLYYLRARCYDADAGRFTQEDTYLGDGRNLYAYTHSNPLKYVDPSGHAVVTCKDDGSVLDDFQERNMAGGGAGKLDINPGGALRQTMNQKALYDLAKGATQAAKSGTYISESEAKILDSWAMEYGVPQHHQAYSGSGSHFSGGNYMDHTHIYNMHVPYCR